MGEAILLKILHIYVEIESGRYDSFCCDSHFVLWKIIFLLKNLNIGYFSDDVTFPTNVDFHLRRTFQVIVRNCHVTTYNPTCLLEDLTGPNPSTTTQSQPHLVTKHTGGNCIQKLSFVQHFACGQKFKYTTTQLQNQVRVKRINQHHGRIRRPVTTRRTLSL